MSTKFCSHCGEHKPLDQFNKRYCGSHRDENGMGLDHRCRSCQSIYSKSLRKAKKNAPPIPEKCDCCHKIPSEPLVLDHVRGTGTVRGWICRNCNQGIGKLGDNIEGIIDAFNYLYHL